MLHRRTLIAAVLLATAGCTGGSSPEPDRMFYDRTIEPILMQKCAASGCHSSTSIAGALDVTSYEAVSQRRDLFLPYGTTQQSMFLLKASGAVPHGAGISISPDSEVYLTLQEWIENGATETGLR